MTRKIQNVKQLAMIYIYSEETERGECWCFLLSRALDLSSWDAAVHIYGEYFTPPQLTQPRISLTHI